jgi:hypothetical protein
VDSTHVHDSNLYELVMILIHSQSILHVETTLSIPRMDSTLQNIYFVHSLAPEVFVILQDFDSTRSRHWNGVLYSFIFSK